jgi:hypothetical protein
MAGITYDVDVVYRTHGTLGLPDLAKPNQAMSELNSKVAEFGKGLGEAMSGAADAMASFALYAGTAVTAALGAALGFAIKFNAELESTQLALAGIFENAGVAKNLTEGLEMGGSILAQMRRDAADLPGEFKELVPIFQTIAVSALHAGMSANQTEALAAKTMAFAAVSKIKPDMAGREMAALLEGHAGQHNILGQRLGIGPGDIHRFNSLTSDKRAAEITKRLSGFQDAFNQEGKTFQGLSSTFVDNVKQFGQVITGPLFEKIKTTLGEANAWFSEHKGQVMAWANTVGYRLGEAFDVVKGKIISWEPAIMKIVNALERFFSNHPMEKFEKMLAGYALLKGGGMALSAGMGMFGGGAGKTAAGGAASAIGGVVGAMSLPVLVAAVSALVIGGMGVEGAIHQVNQHGEGSDEHSEAWHSWESSKNYFMISLREMGDALKTLEPAYRLLADSLGTYMLHSVEMITLGAAYASEGLASFAHWINDVGFSAAKWVKDHGGPDLTGVGDVLKKHNREKVLKNKVWQENDPLNRPGDIINSAPNHHTTIHKVEILVSSNQDASRVARLTKEALAELTRNPKSSRRGPAFTPHQ